MHSNGYTFQIYLSEDKAIIVETCRLVFLNGNRILLDWLHDFVLNCAYEYSSFHALKQFLLDIFFRIKFLEENPEEL
jgi:hypothetical protein